MRFLLVLAVTITLLLALGVACGGDDGNEQAAEEVSEGRTLFGAVTVKDTSSIESERDADEGDPCSAKGGYDDIRLGTEVVVKDGADNILAIGRLNSGTVVEEKIAGARNPDYCKFAFEIPEVPTADFYSIEISHRGELTYTYDELEAIGWNVVFELGGD